MINLYEVIIGNYQDDSTKSKIMVCHEEDTNVINNIGAMADMFIEIVEDWEKIISVKRIIPINISSQREYSEVVKNTLVTI
jgi:hypothetical protein